MTVFEGIARSPEAFAAFLMDMAGTDLSLLWCKDEPGCLSAGEAFVCTEELHTQCVLSWLRSPYPDELPAGEESMLRLSVSELQELMSNKDTCIVALADAVARRDTKLLQAEDRIQRLEHAIAGAATRRPKRVGHCVSIAATESEAT